MRYTGMRADDERIHQPKHAGDKVISLKCPNGVCKENHARLVAEAVVLKGKDCIVWRGHFPCFSWHNERHLSLLIIPVGVKLTTLPGLAGQSATH